MRLPEAESSRVLRMQLQQVLAVGHECDVNAAMAPAVQIGARVFYLGVGGSGVTQQLFKRGLTGHAYPAADWRLRVLGDAVDLDAFAVHEVDDDAHGKRVALEVAA